MRTVQSTPPGRPPDRGGTGYRLLHAIIRTLLRIGWDLQVEGLERLPAAGPYILTPNHPSEIDPIVLSAALPFRPTFVAGRELDRFPVVFAILRAFNPVFVRRTLSDVGAIKACLDRLDRGEVLVVFPEGRVVQDADLGSLHSGAAFLAMRSQVPLVPAVLVGTAAMWPLGARWPRRSRLRVVIGTPVSAPVPEPDDTGALTEAVAGELRRLLRKATPQRDRRAYL